MEFCLLVFWKYYCKTKKNWNSWHQTYTNAANHGWLSTQIPIAVCICDVYFDIRSKQILSSHIRGTFWRTRSGGKRGVIWKNKKLYGSYRSLSRLYLSERFCDTLVDLFIFTQVWVKYIDLPSKRVGRASSVEREDIPQGDCGMELVNGVIPP